MPRRGERFLGMWVEVLDPFVPETCSTQELLSYLSLLTPFPHLAQLQLGFCHLQMKGP